MLLLIVILSAVLIFVAVNMLLTFASKGSLGMDSRMQRYTKAASGSEQASSSGMNADNSQGSTRLMKLIQFLGTKVKKVPQAKGFDLKMQQAGFPLLGSEFLVVLTGASLILFVLVLLFTHDIIMSIAFAATLYIMILMYVKIQISRRRQAFNNQLGDALVMMANSMRSGFSFMQAVDMVASEMSSPIANEFAKLVAEMRLGIPTDEALTNLSKRIGSKDFDLVIIAVIIHRQVGGNLAQILESISSTITERIKMKREINTLTGQGRMSGWIVGLLPFGMAILLEMVTPGYLTPMMNEPIGQLMLGIGVSTQVVGMLCIKRIVDIDV